MVQQVRPWTNLSLSLFLFPVSMVCFHMLCSVPRLHAMLLFCVCPVYPVGIVSLISLAVLSYERYSTMMTPTEADSSNYCKALLGITLSWVYSLIWTMPPLFGWSSYGPEGPGTTCSVDWKAKTANNISYIICLFVFCLILPFLVIVFCYGKLLCAIRQVRHCGARKGFH